MSAKTITFTVDADDVYALAGVIEAESVAKLTPSGAVSRSGKGEYKWVPSFRETLQSVASQIRDQA